VSGRPSDDDLRALFEEVEAPPGMDRWRAVARQQPARTLDGGSQRRQQVRVWQPRNVAIALACLLVAVVVALGVPIVNTQLRALQPNGKLRPLTSVGVPAGTVLRPYAGTLRVTTPGAVVDGLSVAGTIDVEASNVTIRRTRVTVGDQPTAIVQGPGARNLTITDSEITSAQGGHDAHDGVDQEGFGLVVRGCRITHLSVGVQLGNQSEVTLSEFADVATGVSVTGGSSEVAVTHNQIEAAATGTGYVAVLISTHEGPLSGVVVDGNLLGGGLYTLGFRDGGGSLDIEMRGNRFRRDAAKGAVAGWQTTSGNKVWSANVWDATGKALSPAGR